MNFKCLFDGHLFQRTNVGTPDHPIERIKCLRCGKTTTRAKGGFR